MGKALGSSREKVLVKSLKSEMYCLPHPPTEFRYLSSADTQWPPMPACLCHKSRVVKETHILRHGDTYFLESASNLVVWKPVGGITNNSHRKHCAPCFRLRVNNNSHNSNYVTFTFQQNKNLVARSQTHLACVFICDCPWAAGVEFGRDGKDFMTLKTLKQLLPGSLEKVQQTVM